MGKESRPVNRHEIITYLAPEQANASERAVSITRSVDRRLQGLFRSSNV